MKQYEFELHHISRPIEIVYTESDSMLSAYFATKKKYSNVNVVCADPTAD